jgi:uncharacterized protein YuzE
MTINYDPEEDRLRIVLVDAPVSSGDEPKPGFHFYYDIKGRVVGFDIDSASRHVDDPRTIEVSFGE